MTKRKLSRFEKKFKKARAKGKETFKFRKKRLDLTEKRKTYSTVTADDLKKKMQSKNSGDVANVPTREKTTRLKNSPINKKKMGPGFKMGGKKKMYKNGGSNNASYSYQDFLDL